MFLFSRRLRIGPGRTREALAWAIDQTERVNRITAVDVAAYSQVFSPEVGTIVWSAFVPDLTSLEAAADKLMADDGYVAATDEGAQLAPGGADDALFRVIHGAPDPSRRPEYVTAVRAVCATGMLARGMELGVEIAQRAEVITGARTLFLAESTGVYGGVGWLTGHESVQAMEAAEQALMADAAWLALLDREAGPAYAAEPALTSQRVYRRLA